MNRLVKHKHSHKTHDNKRSNNHINAFLNLNGVPYLVGEYLDRTQFRQIDRSLIRSEIFVDQKEAMRAIVDINIDDIGKRADGYPKIVGNSTKQRKLLQVIQQNANVINYRLDTIKRGIILRINYRLENQRTRQIIRSASENIRVRDRNYFIDVNPRNINDNAIIVNFMNSMVSTINEFTHGTDRMLIRITSIQLFYECLKRDIRGNYNKSAFWNSDLDELLPDFENDPNLYKHHSKFQNRHMLGNIGTCDCDNIEGMHPIHPPSWLMFNRFYHFDNMARDIVLHHQEINDINNRIFLVPCGSVIVNRMFMINPGHRIIFKISIWKNDLVAINNTQKVALALGMQRDWFGPPKHTAPINLDLETVIRMLQNQLKVDHVQNRQIAHLHKLIKKLIHKDPGDETLEPNDELPDDEVCCEDYPDCDCNVVDEPGEEEPPEGDDDDDDDIEPEEEEPEDELEEPEDDEENIFGEP